MNYLCIIRDESIMAYSKQIDINDNQIIAKIRSELKNIGDYPKLFNDIDIGNYNIYINKVNDSKLKNDFFVYSVNDIIANSELPSDIIKVHKNVSEDIKNNYKNVFLMGNVDIYFTKMLKNSLKMYNDNYNSNIKLSKIEEDISFIEEKAYNNLDSLIKRGGDISELKDKVDIMSKSTFNVYNNSKKIKNRYIFNKYKNVIIIVVVIIILIIYLIFIRNKIN